MIVFVSQHVCLSFVYLRFWVLGQIRTTTHTPGFSSSLQHYAPIGRTLYFFWFLSPLYYCCKVLGDI